MAGCCGRLVIWLVVVDWSIENVSCESMVACNFSKRTSQKGLNHDLGLELETRGKMLQIPLKIMDLGAFCVEQ